MKKQLLEFIDVKNIAISGPIGVGKTTWLKNNMNLIDEINPYKPIPVTYISELFDWDDKNVKETITTNTYSNENLLPIEEQLSIIDSIYNKYIWNHKLGLTIYDRGIFDPYVFGIIYYRYHKDEKNENILWMKLMDLLEKNCISDYKYIIFETSFEENLRRIKKRNREFENNKGFIEFLCKEFNRLLIVILDLFKIKYTIIKIKEKLKWKMKN